MHKDRIHWTLDHRLIMTVLRYSLTPYQKYIMFYVFQEENMNAWGEYYTLNVRSRGKQLVLFPRESWCFLRRSRGKHHDSKENKTSCFLEGPDIKCFVVFLDFHFNSNKRITGVNQNSRLCTYNNTSLILSILSVYHLHLFPPVAAVSLLGWL